MKAIHVLGGIHRVEHALLGYMTQFGITNETTAKWSEIGVSAEQADAFGLKFLAVSVAVWAVGFGLTKASGEK